MKKKTYIQPLIQVHVLQSHGHLMTSPQEVSGTDVGVNEEVTEQTEEFSRIQHNSIWDDNQNYW